jgi:hypothetical protein
VGGRRREALSGPDQESAQEKGELRSPKMLGVRDDATQRSREPHSVRRGGRLAGKKELVHSGHGDTNEFFVEGRSDLHRGCYDPGKLL